jgi:hypothetical protein
MWQDPVVKETRELRERYAEQFKHDLDAIFEDICNRQEKSGRKHVRFPAREPESQRNIA